eukprot:s205_g15.t2
MPEAAKDAKKEAPKEVKEEAAEKKDAAPSEPMSPANQGKWIESSEKNMMQARNLIRDMLTIVRNNEVAEASNKEAAQEADKREKEAKKAAVFNKAAAHEKVIATSFKCMQDIEDAILQTEDSLSKLTHERYRGFANLQVCERRLELRSKRPEPEKFKDALTDALNSEKQILEASREELLELEKQGKKIVDDMRDKRKFLSEDTGFRRLQMMEDMKTLTPQVALPPVKSPKASNSPKKGNAEKNEVAFPEEAAPNGEASPKEANEAAKEVGKEPKEAAKEPKEAAKEPKEAAKEPKEVAKEPKEAAKEPKEAAKEPKEAAKETKDEKPAEEAPKEGEEASNERTSHTLSPEEQKKAEQASKELIADTLKLLEKCSCHRNKSLETIFKVKQDTNRANHRTEDCLSRRTGELAEMKKQLEKHALDVEAAILRAERSLDRTERRLDSKDAKKVEKSSLGVCEEPESIVLTTRSKRSSRQYRPGAVLVTTGIKKGKKQGPEQLKKIIGTTWNRPELLETALKKYQKIKQSFKKRKDMDTLKNLRSVREKLGEDIRNKFAALEIDNIPVWTAPPTSLKSLDDPLLRGEALLSPNVLTSQAQLPGLRHHPVARTSSAPAFPAADKRPCLEPLQQRPSTGSVTSNFNDDSAGRSLVSNSLGFFTAHTLAEVLPAAEDMLLRLERGKVYDDEERRFAYELPLPKLSVPIQGSLGSPLAVAVQSLIDTDLDAALREVIFNTAAAAHAEGFRVQVSRHDLFHGHFFRRKNGEVPLRQYADEVMQHRNLVILFSPCVRAFVLDAESDCIKALIPEYARKPMYTLYEDGLKCLWKGVTWVKSQALKGHSALASSGLLRQPRKMSQTVVAFERSLSKDFQGQASQTLSDLPPLDQGLSYPARKENFKREKYFMKFESSQSGRAGSAGNTSGNDGTELLEAEELQDEESFVKDLIDDLAKSILFQHLERASIEERAAAKAEEARRRKEAELRRARKKEQMARDPKRKEDGKQKDRSIPLRHYEVYGEKGSEKVNIVDILKIQSQCEMLNESGGVVDQMLVAQYAQLEQRHRSEKLQRALTFTDPGSKNSAALEASKFQSELPPDLSRDERAKLLRKDSAVVHWLLLHFRFKRLHQSSDICLLVLRQLGEWSRIRRAMKGFVDNVTLLQRWCKRFLQVKRRRCTQLEKEWERQGAAQKSTEVCHGNCDSRLAQSWPTKEQKELEKETPSKKTQYKGLTSGKAKRDKQALLSMMEKSVDGGDISIDFRAYKIPGPERRAIINRWYMVTLRNHVRSEQTIAMTIREMLAAERELERFVKTFGTHNIQAPPKPTAEEVAEIKKLKTKAMNDDLSGLRMGGKLKNDWYRVTEELVESTRHAFTN